MHDLATSLAARCGDAHAEASDRTRKLFNTAMIECLDVKGGRYCDGQYRSPFDGIFTVSELEYGTRVVLRFPYSNSGPLHGELCNLIDAL